MTASSAGRLGAALVLAACAGGLGLSAETAALTLRASVIGRSAPVETLRIELQRWSTDAERAPIVAAASELARPPAPAPDPAAAAPAAGRAGRAGGRGGRGAAPVSPAVRMTAAVKAAPTVGFIWGEGVSGYAVKYAWRATDPGGTERIVLVTDRRLGAHSTSWPADDSAPSPASPSSPAPPAAGEAEFTVLELRIDGTGSGEGKSSLTTRIVVDAAKTVALDGYVTAPALLKVTR